MEKDKEYFLINSIGVIISALILFNLTYYLHWTTPLMDVKELALISVVLFGLGVYFLLLSTLRASSKLILININLLYIIIIIILILTTVKVYVGDRFGTDAILFVKYAIDVLMDGKNPYEVSMLKGFEKYCIDYSYVTQILNGDFVDSYSYPALSFLIFIPAYMLKLDLNIMSLLFFILVLLFLVIETPLYLRIIPFLILFTNTIMLHYTYFGVFDIIWVFFTLIAIKYFYDGKYRVSGVFYGLALSVKQIMWYSIPFILVWLLKIKKAKVFITSAIGVFLAINLPFIVMNPIAWFKGVLTPIREEMVPMGYGLSSLIYLEWVDLIREWFTLAQIVLILASLALYYINYEKVKDVAWLVPVIFLFFGWRSFLNYFIHFAPITYYVWLRRVLDEKERCKCFNY